MIASPGGSDRKPLQLGDISSEADDRHGFSESDARMAGIDRHW